MDLRVIEARVQTAIQAREKASQSGREDDAIVAFTAASVVQMTAVDDLHACLTEIRRLDRVIADLTVQDEEVDNGPTGNGQVSFGIMKHSRLHAHYLTRVGKEVRLNVDGRSVRGILKIGEDKDDETLFFVE